MAAGSIRKAGLLTFHSAHHYGAQLQAYALMKAVMKTGADCEIINYVRKDTLEGKRLFKRSLSPGAQLSNVHTLLNYGRLKKRGSRFEHFINSEMRLSEKFYGSFAELSEDAPAYDIYICGSDQIWNPFIYKERTFDPAFFADFAVKGRRIAYAPSFGIAEMPGKYRDVLKGYLDGFDALSARERQGEKIIREAAGRESVTVLDPTLLLSEDEWGEVSAMTQFHEPYILCYFISDASKYAGFVKSLSGRLKFPVISLCGSRRVVPETKNIVLDAGPAEFLELFRNAAFVCTDSFHGTAFSIIFKKDFISFIRSDSGEMQVNSRIYNILEKLSLTSRVFNPCTDIQRLESMNKIEIGPADRAVTETALQNEREMSMAYLRGAIWKESTQTE